MKASTASIRSVIAFSPSGIALERLGGTALDDRDGRRRGIRTW